MVNRFPDVKEFKTKLRDMNYPFEHASVLEDKANLVKTTL